MVAIAVPSAMSGAAPATAINNPAATIGDDGGCGGAPGAGLAVIGRSWWW